MASFSNQSESWNRTGSTKLGAGVIRRGPILAVALLLLAVLLVGNAFAAPGGGGHGQRAKAGRKSPSYTGKTSQGKPVSLKASRRGVMFKLGWSARCDDGGEAFTGKTFNQKRLRLRRSSFKVTGSFIDQAADGVKVDYRVTFKGKRRRSRFNGIWRIAVSGPSTTGGTYGCDSGRVRWSAKRRSGTRSPAARVAPASVSANELSPLAKTSVAKKLGFQTRTKSVGERPPENIPSLTGQVLYTARDCYRNASGQSPAGEAVPLGRATLRLVSGAGDAKDVPLDRNGRFSAGLDASQSYEAFAVLNSPAISVGPDTSPSPPYRIPLGAVTQSDQRFVIGGGNGDTAPDTASGAASIFATLQNGARVAAAALPVPLPKVHARWRYASNLTTWLGDRSPSEYSHATNQILVGGKQDGYMRDEYERSALLHEYGHHVLDTAAPPIEATGKHGSDSTHPDKPALPWSEGFADAFAAIVDHNPRPTLGCTIWSDYSTEPATARLTRDGPLKPMPPPGSAQLAQYNETAVTGALWALVSQLGAGDQQAGLKRLLEALHTFHRRYGGGPDSLREARDALIEGGLETTPEQHEALTELFAGQRIGWAFIAYIEATSDAWHENTSENMYLSLAGPPPYGIRCDPTVWAGKELGWWRGAEGALDYAWQDDCYTAGGGAGMWDQLMLPYPAPNPSADYSTAKFTVYATYTCEAVLDGKCPSGRTFAINLGRGAILGDFKGFNNGDWDFKQWGAVHHVASEYLAKGVSTPVAEFDALGHCKSLSDGWECDDGGP